jgi:hypothetical protein
MPGAKLDLLPKERVSAFAFQAGMAIEADYTDCSFSLDRLDDSGNAFVPKASAQLNGDNSLVHEGASYLLGLGIVVCGHHRQLDCGRDHLRAVDRRIHIRR